MASESVIHGLRAKVFSHSPNAKIFRASVVVAALGMVTAGVTAGKELVIARYFGRDDAIDAFFIAYLLPSFVVVLVVGSLGTALVPVIVEARQVRGNAVAQELFSSIMLVDVAALTGIAVVLGVLAPYYLPYVGSGFSAEKLRLTREMLWALLPFVVFNGSALCVAAVLNAGERFALPAAIPLTTPVVVILCIAAMAERWGAFAIVAGTVAGSVLEAAVLGAALKRQGIRFRLRWGGLSEDVKAVLRQFSPMLAGSFLMGSTLVADKAMAAMLPEGSVAALSYANKVVGAVLALSAASLSTAVFPYFSQMVAEKDWRGCSHTLKRYSVLILTVSVPITVGLMAFSKPLVKLLFERGAFNGADTALVSRVQMCYLAQIPFYVCGMLFVKFLSAARRNQLLMYGAGMSLALDVGLNLAFMKPWGVAGIALSTSAVYFYSFLYLGICSVWVLRYYRQPQMRTVDG